MEEYKCTGSVVLVIVKAILFNPLGLLSDSIINASQQLRRELFPFLPGLQGVELGAIMGFEVEAGEFVQIVHNGKNHWLLISTIGVKYPTVWVYDSMHNSLAWEPHTESDSSSATHRQFFHQH